MDYFFINSNYGHIHFGSFYLGWNNIAKPTSPPDYGDETFEISFRNLYIGCYSNGRWHGGILDENGCLSD
jgi:hypothetical protein